ncbi:hypothetical protein ACTQ9L_03140 [Deinococcus wulumuqiensis]
MTGLMEEKRLAEVSPETAPPAQSHEDDLSVFDGDALDVVQKALGVSPRQALLELVRLAGMTEQPVAATLLNPPANSVSSSGNAATLLETARKKQRRTAQKPRKFDARCLEELGVLTPEDTPQRQSLTEWGLWGSVLNGDLAIYRRDLLHEGYKPRNLPDDAVIVGIRDNEGKTVAYKFFPDRPSGDGIYLGQDGWSPAWRSGDLRNTALESEWIVMGELEGAALHTALLAAGAEHFAVQGLPAQYPVPECLHDPTGRRVYLHSQTGEQQQEWTTLLQAAGARVHVLPADIWNVGGATACDSLRFLGAVELGRRLLSAADHAEELALPEAPVTSPLFSEYAEENGCFVRHYEDSKGRQKTDCLSTFTARIEKDVKRTDHRGQVIHEFYISGVTANGQPLPGIVVPAREFKGMNWLADWGSRAVVMAGPGRLDHLRTAIQLFSRAAVQETVVYQRTGWTQWEGQPVFLVQGQALTQNGAIQTVQADLFAELADYTLPVPAADSTEAIRKSFALTKIAPDHLSFPLLAMTYRAVLGTPRYLMLIVGTSGHGKTAYISQFQAHFGQAWNADRLPSSWLSTGMSILEQASIAKNVLFAVNDVKFNASIRENEQIKAGLNRLINAVGDRKGRSRMNRNATKVSTTPPPGGAVIVSGESALLPFSDAARTVLIQDETNLLASPESSSAFQEATRLASYGVYATSMAAFIQWVARHHAALTDEAFRTNFVYPLREKLSGAGGHARIPDNLADLLACWQVMLTWALDTGALHIEDIQRYWQRAVNTVLQLQGSQSVVLRHADPAAAFLTFLASLLRSKDVYLVDQAHGGPPERPDRWGWTVAGGGNEGQETLWATSRNGNPVGYLGRPDPDGPCYLMLDRAQVYKAVSRLAEQNQAQLPDPNTLWSLLKERLAEDGRMLCEPGKTTHRRSIPGSHRAERVSLVNLREDFAAEDGDDRDVGTGTAKTPLCGDFPFVPVLPELVALFPSNPGTPQKNTESEAPPANPGDRPFRQYLI